MYYAADIDAGRRRREILSGGLLSKGRQEIFGDDAGSYRCVRWGREPGRDSSAYWSARGAAGDQ